MTEVNPTDATDAADREELTWEMFGTATRELAEQIAADDWSPDIVVAVARGGLTVGGALAYALGVKNCGAINVEFYTGVDSRLDVPVVLPPSLNLLDITDLKVLIADDVADTGHTLALVKEFCHGKVAEVRAAVLYEKPLSLVRCEYVWRATDRWIDFPWSTKAAVVTQRPKAS